VYLTFEDKMNTQKKLGGGRVLGAFEPQLSAVCGALKSFNKKVFFLRQRIISKKRGGKSKVSAADVEFPKSSVGVRLLVVG
jgi:hypothetical protein